MNTKYILGLDPGLSEVGFGIVKTEGAKLSYVDCGIIKTTPKHPFAQRLSIIKQDLEEILGLFRFAAVGIEELFFVKNITSGMKVAHARGVLMEAVHRQGLPLHEFKPLEIKNNICGYGNADKLQMQQMVKRLLNLSTLPRPHDAADALGIAICAARVI